MTGPFDSEKYERLLEGRGITEKRLSEVLKHKDSRIEAEFYLADSGLHKNYVFGEKAIPFVQYGTSDELNEHGEGFPVLRLNELVNNFIIEPEKHCASLDEAEFESLRLLKDDVLICRTNGNPKLVGKSAVVMADTQFAFASYLFRVRPNPEIISPLALAIYLNSRVGRVEIEKHSIRSNQVNFSPDKLRQIKIPLFSESVLTGIDGLVLNAFSKAEESKILHGQAERMLLSELGLLHWQPPEPLTYQRKASEAFAVKRLDAEHFQPKYDELFDLLSAKGDVRLGNHLTEPIRRGISPVYVEDGGDTLVINSQHVGKVQVELADNRRTLRALLEDETEKNSENKKVLRRGEVKVGDVLLNSTGMITIGRCQCLLENVKAVVDNHVAIIRPQQILDPIYLACFINALPGRMQTERGWTGSSGQIELRPETIADYRIWNAPPEIQQQIHTLVEQSHTARRQATMLLHKAKRAVEIAIEDSEAAAIVFLES